LNNAKAQALIDNVGAWMRREHVGGGGGS